MSAQAHIQFDRVGKTYADGTRALDGVSFSVPRGGRVALLGPSGCGKSTILRLIAGLSTPSAGRLRRPEGEEVGFVFQSATLMPWATAEENVRLPLTLKRMRAREARGRALAALEQVGLADAAASYPAALSGGMRMRVSIARALVTEPALLVMDEPFGALDEAARFRFNDDLLALWSRHGWTLVFVTHSLYEAVYLSQKVLVMAPGPGPLRGEAAIEAGWPRAADFRLSDAFQDQCRRVAALIGGA